MYVCVQKKSTEMAIEYSLQMIIIIYLIKTSPVKNCVFRFFRSLDNL